MQPWSNITGQIDIPGTGDTLGYTNGVEDQKFYHIRVKKPQP